MLYDNMISTCTTVNFLLLQYFCTLGYIVRKGMHIIHNDTHARDHLCESLQSQYIMSPSVSKIQDMNGRRGLGRACDHIMSRPPSHLFPHCRLADMHLC